MTMAWATRSWFACICIGHIRTLDMESERPLPDQALPGDGHTAASHFDGNDMAKAVHMGSQSMAAGFPFVAVAARIRAQASYAGLVVLILAGCGMALLLIHESQLWRSTITEESR